MEQRGDEFGIEIQDIRHCVVDEGDTLTLLWVLEGRAELSTDAGREVLEANSLAIINRHRRWQLTSETANVTLRVTLSGRWVVQLCNDFFAHDYAVPVEAGGVWPQCDALRDLLRQLLVVTLINDPRRYRLEAYRWLSEILLLLTSRFQQPARLPPRERSTAHSRRIARVIERINASYSRRITLAEIAASEYVSEAWLSRLFRKEVGIGFMQYITALRLEKAADALRLTNRPLHQIALEQGFASTRMMSDRFRRVHNMSPGEFRKTRRQHPEAARTRADGREQRYPVAVDKLFSLLNEPVTRGWGASPLVVHPQQEQRLDLEQLKPLSTSLRRMRVVITLRELDDLLREDVRHNLEEINKAIPIEGIDIAEPFLSSRLFATGWDDPQMAGYACWYNLHQLFTWLAKKRWTVLLHTGVTTRRDLLTRFLQQSVNHFSPEIAAGWHFVMHWSSQASEETREQVWLAQRKVIQTFLPQAKFGLWHRFPRQRGRERRSPVPFSHPDAGRFSCLFRRRQRASRSRAVGACRSLLDGKLPDTEDPPDPRRPSPAQTFASSLASLLEYPHRKHAGDKRLVFSGGAADAEPARAFGAGLAGGILAKFGSSGGSPCEQHHRYIKPGATV